MATYLINIDGQFNDTFSYPWDSTTSLDASIDPLKRVRTLNALTEEVLFEAGTRDCTVIVYNRSTTDSIRVRLIQTGGMTFDINVKPNRFAAFPSRSINVSTSGGAFSSYVEWDEIRGQALAGIPEVEVLIIEEEDTNS
jgi:hypothetical protein